MLEIAVGVVALFWAMLVVVNGTVQNTLFGGRIVTGNEDESEVEWVKLYVLLAESAGSIQRQLKSWAVNAEKMCVTLFFSNETATTLYYRPGPAQLEKWPSMKADGERFARAVAKVTGATLSQESWERFSDDLADALESINGTITLRLKQKARTDDPEKSYTEWRISAKS
jgi:hypothetical protein